MEGLRDSKLQEVNHGGGKKLARGLRLKVEEGGVNTPKENVAVAHSHQPGHPDKRAPGHPTEKNDVQPRAPGHASKATGQGDRAPGVGREGLLGLARHLGAPNPGHLHQAGRDEEVVGRGRAPGAPNPGHPHRTKKGERG